MRGATNDESLGAEIVNRFLGDMRQDLQTNRGARRYVDVTSEGPPRFPGDPDIGEADDDGLPGPTDHSDDEPEVEQAAASPPETPRNVRQRVGELEAATPAPSEPSPQPQSEPANTASEAAYTPERSTSVSSGLGRSGPYYHRSTFNLYIDQEATNDSGDDATFVAEDGIASYNMTTQNFYIRKKRPEDEIDVSKSPSKAKNLFLGKGGSREKEIKAILVPDNNGTRAIRIYRGKEAREMRHKYAIASSLPGGTKNGKTWATNSITSSVTWRYQYILELKADGFCKDSTIRTSIS